MKTAFVIYPEIDLLDLFTLVEPLLRLKLLHANADRPQLEFCTLSALPKSVTAIMQAQLINPVLCPSLEEFDLLIMAGSQPNTDISSSRVKAWLATISDQAVIMATGNAVPLLQSIKPALINKPFTAKNRIEVISLGIRLVDLVAGNSASRECSNQLGLPMEWVERNLQPARTASLTRKTKETSIELQLSLDGNGSHDISTGIPFFDHMLTQIAVHGLFDLELQCKGDLQIDPHHTVEDVGLALGKAFDQALGDRKGLVRMASASVPMDESLAQVSLDFSGRPFTVLEATWNDVRVGDLPVTLIGHFLESFAVQARCNLSARVITGGDDHHKAEAIFKALARALDAATRIDPRRSSSVPSSKGVI